MKNKLIFLDIDGTLTTPGSNLPPESALEAIRAAQRAGHEVFLCSGRNYEMLRPLLTYGFDGAVASGGGYVFAGDRVLYDCPMTELFMSIGLDELSVSPRAVLPLRQKVRETEVRVVREKLLADLAGSQSAL